MLDAVYAVFEALGLADDAAAPGDAKRRRAARVLLVGVGCAVVVGLGVVVVVWLMG